MMRRRGAARLALAFLAAVTGAQARDVTLGAITVVQPWTRATPGGSTMTAGYLVVRNTGDAPDRLLAIAAEGIAKASPHTMAMKDGVMQMRPLAGGIVIPPHGEIVFQPGADHVMFEGLKRPLRKGDHVPGVLTFEKAGAVPIVFDVEAIGAQAPASGGTSPPKTD